MKTVLLFAAAAMLLVGCESPYETNGVGSYGYTYDLNLPHMSGSPAALQALNETPGTPVVAGSPTLGPLPPGPAAQSVTFYEGAQAPQTAVAATTPTWTVPAPVTSVPGAVPGVVTGVQGVPVNEAAGAAAGEVAPQTAAPVGGGFFGDGGVTIVGSNGLPTSQTVFPTNITISNIIVTNLTNTGGNTNGAPMTNAVGAITNANGSTVITNFTGGPSNFALTNGTSFTPVPGATNNLNNLPRANATAPGAPSGTTLVPARPLGQPPTPFQSQVISGTTTTPNTPTQPGPTTTEAAGAATGNATVIGGGLGVQQNTTTGTVQQNTGTAGTTTQGTTTQSSSGATTTTPTSSAAQQQQQRILLQHQAAQRQAAPAPAPAAAPK